MNYQLLSTKLNKPESATLYVPRKDIEKKLSDNFQAGLILVSSFAGSGKTTIISEWIKREHFNYVWYSLDARDNDLQLFFIYLLEGIKDLDQMIASELLQLWESFDSIGYDAFMRAFITNLHRIDKEFVLVLDDYHIIENEKIDTFIQLLIEYLPLKMKLVIITREDLAFPLSKYRVSNKILELRIADLRFTKEEAATFLANQLGQDIDEEQAALLTKRTEGWIAGLQLAVLSMQGVQDINRFVKEFSGRQTYVMDYLIEEVLEKQPQEVKDFLLKTSILEYFSFNLCDSLLDQGNGYSSRMIAYLQQNNLFLIPLDQDRKWYRYHHLFRELLRQRLPQYLQSIGSTTVEELHCRAGDWFNQEGLSIEAIHHYLAGQFYNQAAALIECKWAEMDGQSQSSTWLAMSRLLPESIIENRPVLALGYGWALIDTGDLQGSQKWLARAQKLYEFYDKNPEKLPVSDINQFNLLPATIAAGYAYIAAATADIEGIFKHSHDALAKAPPDQYQLRGIIAMLSGFAHWTSGDLLAAEKIIVDMVHTVGNKVNDLTLNSFYLALGELFIQMGRLKDAKSLFKNIISQVDGVSKVPILWASLYLGLANIAYLEGNNQEVYQLLKKSWEYGQNYALMDWEYKYYLLFAKLYASEGLFDMALDSIYESKKAYFVNPIPDYCSLEEMELLIQIRKGPGLLSSEDLLMVDCFETNSIPYLAEFSAAVYTEKILAENPDPEMLRKAGSICNTLINSAKKQKRMGPCINYLVLASKVKEAEGQFGERRLLLDEAAVLAKDQDYYQPFLEYLSADEGLNYVKKDVLHLKKEIANQRLIEPLTIRELEVLSLIVSGLSNQEISNRLFLALSTVKGYNQNIYAKLDVKRRTEAVAKARELGII